MKVYCFNSWINNVLFKGPDFSEEAWKEICDTAVKVAAEKEILEVEKNSTFFNFGKVIKMAAESLEEVGFTRIEAMVSTYEGEIFAHANAAIPPAICSTKGSRYYQIFGDEIGDKIIKHNKEMYSRYLYTDS
jgi:hypothetical protein